MADEKPVAPTKVRITPSLEEVRKARKGKRVKKYNKRFLLTTGQQARSKTTIATIVNSTEQLLNDPSVGLNWITTQYIANHAGISIGSFYNYFEDIVAVLDYVWPDRLTSPPKKKKKKTKPIKDSSELPPQ